ncbi:hypothetical protein evm_013371 [Chilo suppressalis]|nr:hypothetical protein evm_013371 [Chilo suppressalis]
MVWARQWAAFTSREHRQQPWLESTCLDPLEVLANILPGVLADLQVVATSTLKPDHVCILTSLEAIHRILCLTMSDRFLPKKTDITAEDFAKSFRESVQLYSQQEEQNQNEVSCKEKQLKELPKRSPEWYKMASDKLVVVTKSLISLRTHEHFKVRKELAVFCARVLNECTLTMQPSQPIVLDILITLAKDEYPAVSEYCTGVINAYFETASFANKHRVMDSLCENFFVMLNGLPRVLNNIDCERKLSALSLLHGYIQVLCDNGRPQRLTSALGNHNNMKALCAALKGASQLDQPAFMAPAPRDLIISPPLESGWLRLSHLDNPACVQRMQQICELLGAAETAQLILDRLLEEFQQERAVEIVCIINWMLGGSNDDSFACRVLDAYLEDSVWYSPLEPAIEESAPSGTLDVSVYNPRAWDIDRVPDLYEGTVETRFTGISYDCRRPDKGEGMNSGGGKALGRNLLLCCALVEGVGGAARRMGDRFQRYLLKAGVRALERAGSRYELLHLSGVKALNDMALALGHEGVSQLIQHNADYFTHQVTVRLKKAWNTQSALEILSVVMEYSDPSLFDFLCGVAKDVLVQSCDKYYEHNLEAYLQVFLTFLDCIRKWFPNNDNDNDNLNSSEQLDLMEDLLEYIRNTEEVERLMATEEFEQETGRSVEEMYKEDLKRKEEDALDYDDRVTEDKQPLPQHVSVTLSIMDRCRVFVSSERRDAASTAMRALSTGLPVLMNYQDELLPLVHRIWAPLAVRFTTYEPVIWRRALDLLVTMATLSKDFIHHRCVKEVMPHIYSSLHKWSECNLKASSPVYGTSTLLQVQAHTLAAMPTLAGSLQLRDDSLSDAMRCVQLYLAGTQPEQLQKLAVEFFVSILKYDVGAAWYHLRNLCDNKDTLEPPLVSTLQLQAIVGTPYRAENKLYEANIKAIFASSRVDLK